MQLPENKEHPQAPDNAAGTGRVTRVTAQQRKERKQTKALRVSSDV